MNIEHIQTAVREGIPFVIKMADGEQYKVTDDSQIALGKTRVIVIDENDQAHLLPLLTMTGISHLGAEK